MLKLIEWLGVALALSGALLLAREYDIIGYSLMIVSALFLGYHAGKIKMHGLLTMQLIFCIINIIGTLTRMELI
jgi:drug/metabolite transporter (DMT)-like permease